MFCHKCGNKLPEGSGFCNGCGAKLVAADITSPPSDNTIDAMPTPTSTHGRISSTGLKEHVDAYVNTNTKFASANELLTKSRPLLFIWICIGVSILIMTIVTRNPWGILIGAALGYCVAFVAGVVIRIRFARKNKSKEYVGRVDRDALARFLNMNMNYSPEFSVFGEWEAYEGQAINSSSLLATVGNVLVEDDIMVDIVSCSFGKGKQELRIKFTYIKDEEKTLYFVESVKVKSKALKVLEFIANNNNSNSGFGEYSCDYKTIPIVTAAVEYYLNTPTAHEPTLPSVQDESSADTASIASQAIPSAASVDVASYAESIAPPQKSRKILVGIAAIVGVLIIAIIAIVANRGNGDTIPVGGSTVSVQPDLFQLALGVQPMDDFGFEATYGDLFNWLIDNRHTSMEEQGNVAYLTFAGTVTGGDYPVSIVLRMTGVDSPNQRLYPHAMTLNRLGVYTLSIDGMTIHGFYNREGVMTDLFWAHHNRSDYRTFMDYFREHSLTIETFWAFVDYDQILQQPPQEDAGTPPGTTRLTEGEALAVAQQFLDAHPLYVRTITGEGEFEPSGFSWDTTNLYIIVLLHPDGSYRSMWVHGYTGAVYISDGQTLLTGSEFYEWYVATHHGTAVSWDEGILGVWIDADRNEITLNADGTGEFDWFTYVAFPFTWQMENNRITVDGIDADHMNFSPSADTIDVIWNWGDISTFSRR